MASTQVDIQKNIALNHDSMMRLTILIIGNDTEQCFPETLTRSYSHLNASYAASVPEAEEQIKKASPHLVLTVRNSKIADGFSSIRSLLENHPALKVMIFPAWQELLHTFEALAQLPVQQLQNILIAPNGSARPSIAAQTSAEQFKYDGLIGNSDAIQKLKEIVVKFAPTVTTVLLQGESGTGKEVIARAIHAHSLRSRGIFMPVDCAAINESVIESELFGHVRGAFTSADRNTLGLIRSADGGTLFLDEIAELSLVMQSKLLRTLQERTVKPVGSSTFHPVDIRIIAATNNNLSEAVNNGTFRQDLFYRLNALTIYIPPLRERLSDIPLLCVHFTRKLAGEGYPEKTLSQGAINDLCRYDWPGNVRELENVIRSAVTLSSDDVIEREDLNIPRRVTPYEEPEVSSSSMAFHEKEAIRMALKQTSGNRREAAMLLGISEATLYRRIKLYSI